MRVLYCVLALSLAGKQLLAQNSAGVPPVTGEKRLALVIGNNKNPVMPLANAVNDARGMEAALSAIGFQVTLLTDGTQRQMDEAIHKFAAAIPSDSVVLFYFAGHGEEVRNNNYLIPIDLDARNEQDVMYGAIKVAYIVDILESSKARVKLLVLDACRNNPYRFLPSAGGLAKEAFSGEGTFVAFATAPGSVAADQVPGMPKSTNSVFTSVFITQLQESPPGITLDGLFNNVRKEVVRLTGTQSIKQVPYTSSGLIGDWYPKGVPGPESISQNLREISQRSLEKAQAQMARSNFDTALPLLRDSLQINQWNPDARIYRSLVHALQGKREDLLVDASDAVQVAPQTYLSYLTRALAYRNSGRCDKAIDDLNRAAIMAPSESAIYRLRSACYAELANYEQAEEDALKAQLLAAGKQ